MQVLAKELGAYQIRVNSVVPGWIWGGNVEGWVEREAAARGVPAADIVREITARIPQGRIPRPEDVAEAIVFFAGGPRALDHRTGTGRQRRRVVPLSGETVSLDGKGALVTGGGSGLGQACAVAMARAGARVMVADVNEAGGAETVKLVEEAGSEADFVRTDVTDEAQVDRHGRRHRGALGPSRLRREQRRHDRAQRVHGRLHARAVERDHRAQPHRRVPVPEVRDPEDARGRAAVRS